MSKQLKKKPNEKLLTSKKEDGKKENKVLIFGTETKEDIEKRNKEFEESMLIED